MMKITIKTSLLVFFIPLSVGLFARQQQDFQTRIGLDVSGDIVEDIAWSAKAQQRWRYNSSVADKSLFQGGLDYGPLSYLKVGVGYRGIVDLAKQNSAVYKQRMHSDVILHHRFNRLKITYRARLQYGFDDFKTFSFVDGQSFTCRHRMALKYYPFGWVFRPQISTELFSRLYNPTGRSVNGVRYTIGADYLLGQHLAVNLECLLNKELNVANPCAENILSVGFDYRF